MRIRANGLSWLDHGCFNLDASCPWNCCAYKMDQQKIKNLDGLRAFAAIIVVIHHYILGFLPAMYNGNLTEAHIGNGAVESYLASSPLGIFYAGNFAVCVFYVLSGFVLSYKFFKTQDREILSSAAVRRYFRLILPIFAVVFLAYLGMKFGLFFNKEVSAVSGSTWWFASQWNFEASFLHMLKSTFYGVFFQYDASYNTALWMITYEFLGSFLTLAFLAFFGTLKKRYIAYIICGLLLITGYYWAFLLGIILSDIYINKPVVFQTLKKYFAGLAGPVLFLIGLFLGAYPLGKNVDGTIYGFLGNGTGVFWHVFGAFLVIGSTFIWQGLTNFLSKAWLMFISKISFSIYLIHALVLGSFASYLFLQISPRLPYLESVLISFAASLPIIFISGWLTTKYIDEKGIVFSKWIYGKIAGKSI